MPAASDSVAVEDSVAGVASARAAGMKVVAVTHSYPARELQEADLVVSSLAAITPETVEALVGS
jgi:beta-phosphoglucomutase-like phosphatase (HAD superfamily)